MTLALGIMHVSASLGRNGCADGNLVAETGTNTAAEFRVHIRLFTVMMN
jgi:hypothetical protein